MNTRNKVRDIQLTETEQHTLLTGLQNAGRDFQKIADDFAKWDATYRAYTPEQKAQHDAGLVQGSAYKGLAEQFQRQAKDTRELAAKIAASEGVLLMDFDPSEVEPD